MSEFDVRKAVFGTDNNFNEQKQEQVDTRLTADLVKLLKLTVAQRNAFYAYAESVHHRRPFIADFRDFHPDFPVYVAVRTKLALRDNAGLSQLFPFTRAAKLPFINQFLDMLKEEKHDIGDRASAMLLLWPGPMSVALHNMPVPREHSGVGFFITNGKKLRLTLEPLDQFVKTVRLYLQSDPECLN